MTDYDMYLEEERKHNALALAVFETKRRFEEDAENEDGEELRVEDKNI
jgi:hypothetical protein